MGYGFSSVVAPYNPPSPETSLGNLPEGCAASVLVYLDPPEICRLARLNRAFIDASSADSAWECELPSDCDSIIQRVFDHFPAKLCKKNLYARLCRQNSFDGGTKKMWLDRHTGKVCLSISSKGLGIRGIHDQRYWTRIPTEESRFGTVAYLQQIWWFEIDGEVKFPFPPGTYNLFFRLHLGRPSKRFTRRGRQLGTRPRLGHKTCSVSAFNF